MTETLVINPWIEKLGKEWGTRLLPILNSESFSQLGKFLTEQRKVTPVYPLPSHRFNAYKYCPFENVKVVIFGQEPDTDGLADGMAFSSINGTYGSKMLEKILDAVDLDIYDNKSFPPCVAYPNLRRWCEQGIFLPNLLLSSENNKKGAHLGKGWEPLIETTVKELNKKPRIVWMLWGNPVQKTIKPLLTNPHHLILEDSYPGGTLPFNEEKLFSQASEYVEKHYQCKITW